MPLPARCVSAGVLLQEGDHVTGSAALPVENLARMMAIAAAAAAPPVRSGRRCGGGVARDVMIRNPSRVAGTDTLVEVASVMRSLLVAFLPVCDINGDLLGIIALDDLPRAVRGDNSIGATASALAREPAVAIGVDDRVDRVWDLMAEHGMWLLPVLDRRRLAGVIRYSGRRGARPRVHLQRVDTDRTRAVT